MLATAIAVLAGVPGVNAVACVSTAFDRELHGFASPV